MHDNLPAFSTIAIDEIESTLSALIEKNEAFLNHRLAEGAPFTWDDLMAPKATLDDALDQFWSPISHLHAVQQTPALRAIYPACLSQLSAYSTRLSHRKDYYEAICSLIESPAYHALSQARQRVLSNQKRDFELAGIHLDPTQQAAFAKHTEALTLLSTQFENNVLDSTTAWFFDTETQEDLAGLPPHIVAGAKARAAEAKQAGWRLSLHAPDYLAVLSHATTRTLRETYYKAYATRASSEGDHDKQHDNTALIDEILTHRHALATLLGFKDYASYGLQTKMLTETKQVTDFLTDLLNTAQPQAVKEEAALQSFAKTHCGLDTLMPWDRAYVSEQYRQTHHALSDELLRAYFPVAHVLSGLFEITQRLFSVRAVPIEGVDRWHQEVRCVGLYDANNTLISYCYIDLFARNSKRGGAWMDECRIRRRCEDGSLQLPIAFLTCNFTPPDPDGQAFLTHSEVETLFHEWGHTLQHMLTTQEEADISGIRGIPWDAVEVPSQLLENWVWDYDSLSLLSCHKTSGESLPKALFGQLLAAKNDHAALQLIRQIEFSLFDFALHQHAFPADKGAVRTMLQATREKTKTPKVPAYHRFENGFSHIFAGGYAAGYYSYLWAHVMSADLFSLFKEHGIFDARSGKTIRDTFLAMGGAEEVLSLCQHCLGRTPAGDALLIELGIT
jgi:oligopeptidase A